MKNLKYFYRNGIPVATANSDNDSTFYFYAGFNPDHEYHGKICIKIHNVPFYYYPIKFENETLNKFWWVGTEDYNEKALYDRCIDAIDFICKKPDNSIVDKGGFKLI